MKAISIKVNSPEELIEALSHIFNLFENKEEQCEECICLSNVIDRIAHKMGMTYDETCDFLSNVRDVNEIAEFHILLKELAIMLDKKYEDHISKCDTHYVISSLDGKIYKLPKNKVVNYRTFACFRTVEDAKTALKVLENRVNHLYGEN